MGEAKRRGSREERIAAAEPKKLKMSALERRHLVQRQLLAMQRQVLDYIGRQAAKKHTIIIDKGEADGNTNQNT